jgi:heat shock protein HslJ
MNRKTLRELSPCTAKPLARRKARSPVLLIVLLGLAVPPALAKSPTQPKGPAPGRSARAPARPPAPKSLPASPQDVGTVEDIVRVFYENLSGPAGAPRQWDRDRTLYMPGATIVKTSLLGGKVDTKILSPDDYRRSVDARVASEGLFATPIGFHAEKFGNVAQVRSVWASRSTQLGQIKSRNVNLFQLYWDGTRWWITNILSDEERSDSHIPVAWLGGVEPQPEKSAMEEAAALLRESSKPAEPVRLAGRSWQLVRFQGAQTLVPDVRSKYTISFGSEGRVSVRIDCNRGMGTWESTGSNQLRLGQLSLTRAACPARPLNDRMARDWPQLRSYEMKDGHLFVSGGGGTYEFEPL